MATLTTEQQNNLWNNRFESVKCYDNDTTQDADTFHCYRFSSKLDQNNYYVTLEVPDVEHSSDSTAIETVVKAVLATMEYKEPIQFSSVEV